MNSRPLRLFLSAGLAVVLLASLSGCGAAARRAQAARTVATLQATASARDQAYEATVRELLRQTLEQGRATALEQWKTKCAEAGLTVHRELETFRALEQKRIRNRLRLALDPVLDRLEADVVTARSVQASDREAAAALKLASTVAVAGDEFGGLLAELDERIVAARASLLAEIETRANQPPATLLRPVTDADLDPLLRELRERGAEYRTELASASNAIAEHIVSKLPLSDFFQGLVGDRATAILLPVVQAKIDAWQEKAAVEGDRLINDVVKKISAKASLASS